MYHIEVRRDGQQVWVEDMHGDGAGDMPLFTVFQKLYAAGLIPEDVDDLWESLYDAKWLPAFVERYGADLSKDEAYARWNSLDDEEKYELGTLSIPRGGTWEESIHLLGGARQGVYEFKIVSNY